MKMNSGAFGIFMPDSASLMVYLNIYLSLCTASSPTLSKAKFRIQESNVSDDAVSDDAVDESDGDLLVGLAAECSLECEKPAKQPTPIEGSALPAIDMKRPCLLEGDLVEFFLRSASMGRDSESLSLGLLVDSACPDVLHAGTELHGISSSCSLPLRSVCIE